jgi:hypothetical protein
VREDSRPLADTIRRVQPLPTETGPRSDCAQCGQWLPPPNGSATFVYGVGPVGYQSCASCGATWRYLWQDLTPAVRVRPDRSHRGIFVFGAIALVVLLIVGAVALARSQRWSHDDDARKTETPSSVSTPAGSSQTVVVPVDLKDASARYGAIAAPLATGRDGYMKWFVASASSTPQLEVTQLTEAYIDQVRTEIRGLRNGGWPSEVSAEVEALADAGDGFVDDLEQLYHGQAGSLLFQRTIRRQAALVADAEGALQAKLGR